MTKLTVELLDYINTVPKSKIEKIDEDVDSSTIHFRGGFSVIFEMTPENFLNQIRPSDSVYRGRLYYLKSKIGKKKFSDFTVEDWLKLIELFGTVPTRGDLGTIFGCGGEDWAEDQITEIDGKKYMEYVIYGW
jgi:hypothetical protein